MIVLSMLFFLSGAAGLVYEVRGRAPWPMSWAPPPGPWWSMAAVFAVFLGGLALGAEFIGRRTTLGIAALLFGFVSALGMGSLPAPVLIRRLRVRSFSGVLVLA